MVQERTGTDGSQILETMASRSCFFAMDIGTGCDDLAFRYEAVQKALAGVSSTCRAKAKNMMHYSAGIWPSPEAIRSRNAQMDTLADSVKMFTGNGGVITAVGECGLDHHWNPSGEDGRCEKDFDKAMYDGERELFEMQLSFAQHMNLPVIVHSRDASADTLSCIRHAGYDCGIIHCYSYGLEEAKAFLERGWYISFSGSVTYTKRSKMEDMVSLLRYVPSDRILCETDAPYLAPVPVRGQSNTPVFVEHTCRFIAAARGVSAEELSGTVDQNCRTLFRI